jgi:hypothetical protein
VGLSLGSRRALFLLVLVATNAIFLVQERWLAGMAVYALLPGATDPVWKCFLANHFAYYAHLFDGVVGLHVCWNLLLILHLAVTRRHRAALPDPSTTHDEQGV